MRWGLRSGRGGREQHNCCIYMKIVEECFGHVLYNCRAVMPQRCLRALGIASIRPRRRLNNNSKTWGRPTRC